MGEPLLYQIPGGLIACGLFLAVAVVWEIFFRLGLRNGEGKPARDLGPIDAAVAGLLALILAFSFSLASERFDMREEVIVTEATAIGTAHLRCDFLVAEYQQACRDGLSRYAKLRVEFYEIGHDLEKRRVVVAHGERLQSELWQLVRRSQAVRDSPALALAASSMNAVIDLGTVRLAAQRRIVPQEVTALTLTLVMAWGAFAGYACGLSRNHQRVSWFGFAALVSAVIFMSIDLDRPGRGFIHPVRGHSVMVELAGRLAAPP